MTSPQLKKILILIIVVLSAGLMSACSLVSQPKSLAIPVTSITEQQKVDLLAYVYDEGTFPSELSTASNASIVVVRKGGKRVGAEFVEGNSLKENIALAKEALISKAHIDRNAIHDYAIHLHVLDSRRTYDTAFELGSDAIRMSKGNQHGVYRGSYAIEENKSEQEIRELLCTSLQLAKWCAEAEWVQYFYAPELHIARSASGNVVSFYKGKQLDQKTAFDLEEVRNGIAAMKKRLVDNLDQQGQFTYVYNPTPATYSRNNNLIRQFMASRVLAEMSDQDETLLPLHKRNLEYIFKTRYQEDETNGWVLYAGTTKLGAIGILLRTLAVSPYLDTYQEEADKLAATIVDLQNPDGSLNPWWIEPDYAYDKEYLLTFYSGEGILALIEYYIRTREQRRLDAAIKSQEYYLDKYVTHISENYYPAYVPRHTLSLYNLYVLTKDERYADAILLLNDKLIDEILHTTVTTGSVDLLGRFYNPKFPQYGTPHSASDGVYVEWLAYAYEIASMRSDSEHQEKYRAALELWAHNLLNLQYDEMDAYFVEHPERVIGALRFNNIDNRIRTDTTQHALDALIKIEQIFSKQ